MSKIIVATFYQFIPQPDFRTFHPHLKVLCEEQKIKGSILLAEEGINGTVAGSRSGINALKSYLETRFPHLEYKESWAKEMPFHRMKVRLKKEIVTLGMPDVKPWEKCGTYVNPQDWNALISDPSTLLIDARNTYEVEIGTFQGAKDPHTRSFREFPHFAEGIDKTKYNRVAMFCTGGIRCEKASAYLLSHGFKDVYQLKGGILKYLEDVPPKDSLWEGECFVFDGRVAISHGLNLGHYESCHGCRHPISEEDLWSPHYERGVSCPHCYSTLTPQKRASARERQKQEDIARRRGQKHIGAVMDITAATQNT